MSRRRSIDAIQTLAESAEAESARTLAERRRRLAAEEQRLEQLRHYLAEYRTLSAGGDGLLVDVVRARRDFVGRIQAGIDEQERVLAGIRAQADADLARWREARTRSLAVSKLGERLAEQAAERQERRQQADLDEIGRKMFLKPGG